MEGVSNEAASIAGQHGLGKLVYFYDDNRITIDGTTSLSFTAEDRGARFEAQGWHVQHVARRERPRRARRRDRGGEGGDRATVADRRPQPHRLSGPARDGHGQGARRPARRGRGAPRRRRRWAGIRRSASTSPTRCTQHMSQAERGAALQARVGRARSTPGAPRSPTLAPTGTRCTRGRPRDGLGRGAARVPGRRGRGHARRRQGRDAGAQAVHADDGRRRGRPRRVDEDRVRRRRPLLGDARGPQHRLRDPRARDGLDRERDRAPRRDRSSPTARRSSSSPTTCARPCASRRSTHFPVDLGLDARLDRRRRGRADAPARRAPDVAARDAEPLGRAPGRRERDGRRLEGRDRAGGRAGRARAVAPEAADARPERGRARRRARAGRLHALGERPAGRDPDRDRLRGLARARGGPEARGRERHRGARRLDAVLGAVRGAAAELPRRGAAAGGEGAALGRGRRLVRLGALGRDGGRLASPSTASAPPRPAPRSSSSSASPSTTSSRAPPRSWSASHDEEGEGKEDEQAPTAVRAAGRASGSTTSRASCSTAGGLAGDDGEGRRRRASPPTRRSSRRRSARATPTTSS